MNMDTQKLELSDDELNFEELDAVSGGECSIWEYLGYPLETNPLTKMWIKQGCPVK
jgi:hypothetical protein